MPCRRSLPRESPSLSRSPHPSRRSNSLWRPPILMDRRPLRDNPGRGAPVDPNFLSRNEGLASPPGSRSHEKMPLANSPIRFRHAALAAAAALFLTACGGGSDAVVMGVAGPFSTPYGASMRQGAQQAAREINEAGG